MKRAPVVWYGRPPTKIFVNVVSFWSGANDLAGGERAGATPQLPPPPELALEAELAPVAASGDTPTALRFMAAATSCCCCCCFWQFGLLLPFRLFAVPGSSWWCAKPPTPREESVRGESSAPLVGDELDCRSDGCCCGTLHEPLNSFCIAQSERLAAGGQCRFVEKPRRDMSAQFD